jgi:hypothetical protein
MGFLTALRRLKELYTKDPQRVQSRAKELHERLRQALAPVPAVGVPGVAQLTEAARSYRQRFDSVHGGLSGNRKFPGTLPVTLLLRMHRRTGDAELADMAAKTLDAMRRGGIYDHVGGGFHRYTVEPTWTVPHFEKMLYDNALLVLAYVEGWQVTQDAAYKAVARDVLDYVAREMTSPLGTFYSATDADSEGEEGLFFIWDPERMRAAVGPELAELATAAYGLDKPANFEGHWVLRRDTSSAELARARGQSEAEIEAALAQIRTLLRNARQKRIPPLRDDKQLVAWNGLMIQAFARAGLVFRDAALAERGARAADALLQRAHRSGALARYLIRGEPQGSGILDDYAFFVAGLLDLFEATGKRRWLDSAIELTAEQDRRFFDDAAGGYWMTPDDVGPLLVRSKRASDAARPSGNAIAALNQLRLYHLTSNGAYAERAEMTLRVFSEQLRQAPTAYGRMLEALDFMLDTPKEILIVTPGDPAAAEPFLAELAQVYLPNRILAVAPASEVDALAETVPLFAEKRALQDQVTAYVCENRVCELPARDPALFGEQLRRAAHPYETVSP